MADHIFPLFKRFKHILLRMKWSSIERIPNVRVPMLFVGGTQDEVVPPPHTKRLHDAASLAPFKTIFMV